MGDVRESPKAKADTRVKFTFIEGRVGDVYVYLMMMREGRREEEVLQWFVSILKRAEGGGREGGRKGVKRDATLVLLASSLAVLYVVAGGCVNRGKGVFGCGSSYIRNATGRKKRTIVETSRLGTTYTL